MKRAIFHAIMWTIAALPILLVASLLFVSGFAYDILRHPERHENANGFRIWNYVASGLYFTREANIWQNKKECVEFDEVLLYKPSLGCSFVNREFSTQLTFSEDGRAGDNERKSPSNQAILLAGDSFTMGWGVNDNETFGRLIASQINVPVFNLGVSSYGTVREIMRVRMHPRFRDANCIIIQYYWNDLEENQTFLTLGALPTPTRARFEQLFDYKPRKQTFLAVMQTTQEYIWRQPSAFFADLLGLRNFPESLWLINGQLGTSSEHADVFIDVVRRFPELNDKIIFVFGPNDFVDALALRNTLEYVLPLRIEIPYDGFNVLDIHLNKKGHQAIATRILEELRKNEKGRQCLYSR